MERPYDIRRDAARFDLSDWEIGAGYVAESCDQSEIIDVFRSSLRQLARLRGWKGVMVGADNYFAWMREHPLVRVAPDVYLLDDPPKRLPRMWETWKRGHRPPRWALEIVSVDWRKDYEVDPAKYASLGCRELVVFDPVAAMEWTNDARRVALTVHRLDSHGHPFVHYRGPGPAFSPELGVWLVAGHEGYSARLRLSEDREGTKIVPTFEEGQLAERTEREHERAEKEREQAEKEHEQAEKERERTRRRAAERARDEAERARRAAEERAAELERKLRKKPR